MKLKDIKEKNDEIKCKVEKCGNYEYIRNYKNGDVLPNNKIAKTTYLQIKHKYCGSTYEVTLYSFINQGKRCGKCCRKYEKSFAYHIEVELGETLDEYWDFDKNTINPYHISKNMNKKVWIKCQEKDYHGSYEVRCDKFAQGRRCGYCNSSRGEKKIKEWLIENNITYTHDEPYFKDLLSDKKNPLRPDFILPNEKIWIEYDGEFHYRDIYKDGSYEILLEYDRRKDNYANKHSWDLIRIPYWEFENIEKILNKKLKEAK